MEKESLKYGKVYGFTNENVSSFKDLYDFDNADVLTVLGSGDQYFTSILNGAKNVDVYDINRCAWFHFVLKFMAIRVLSFYDFYDFFVNKKMDNMDTYVKISRYLPNDVRTFFKELIKTNRKFSSIIMSRYIGNGLLDFENGRIIPYFDETNYYKLQEKLRNIELPKIFFYGVEDLPDVINKKYDIMLLSNVFHYLSLDEMQYREFLEKFPVDTFQALYTWELYNGSDKRFINAGFTMDLVDSVIINPKSKNDYVLSLRK
ncbi:MAG: DUF3419 family protein [Bacilli bacterium]